MAEESDALEKKSNEPQRPNEGPRRVVNKDIVLRLWNEQDDKIFSWRIEVVLSRHFFMTSSRSDQREIDCVPVIPKEHSILVVCDEDDGEWEVIWSGLFALF